MPAANSVEVLHAFKDSLIAKVILPLVSGEVLELECLVQGTDPAHFEATFLPGQLPFGTLSLDRNCKISFQKHGHYHILNARIVRVLSSEKLLLLFKRAKVNTHAREYFRVDALGKVCYQKLTDQSGEKFDYQGLINISGVGVRFPIRRSCRLGEKFRIGLVFNDPHPVKVECIGEVVRAINFSKNPYVALKFVELDSQDQEKFIAFCMAVQREDLRTKVEVVNFL